MGISCFKLGVEIFFLVIGVFEVVDSLAVSDVVRDKSGSNLIMSFFKKHLGEVNFMIEEVAISLYSLPIYFDKDYSMSLIV